MHCHPPHAKLERAILIYLQVCEEYIYNHSRMFHPLLHPGWQSSGILHQCDLPPVGRRREPPPLLVIRGAFLILFNLPPPLFTLPFLQGNTKYQVSGDLAFSTPPVLPWHSTVPLWGGGGGGLWLYPHPPWGPT